MKRLSIGLLLMVRVGCDDQQFWWVQRSARPYNVYDKYNFTGSFVRLTQYTNFTLRALQLLALRHPAIVTVDDIARAHRISRSHLVKVAHVLGQQGYIETIRGRGGGLRLARPAETITVGEIVRLTEAPLELVECFNLATNSCPLCGICRLSQGFRQALAAFMAVLDTMTIADIAANRLDLEARLTPLVGFADPAGES